MVLQSIQILHVCLSRPVEHYMRASKYIQQMAKTKNSDILMNHTGQHVEL